MYPTKKLSEIAKTTSGWTPSRDKKEFWWGIIPWLKSWELWDNLNISQSEEFITEEWLNNSSTKIFKKGTLLIAMYGATAGKLWILWFDATTNQAVCSIQNIYNQFVEKYIYYFLFSIRERIIKDSFWWAQPNISKWYLDKLEIPLPPLSIQSRIVEKLDEAFGSIDKQIKLLNENIEDLEDVLNSSLQYIFKKNDFEMKNFWSVVDNYDGKRKPVKSSDRAETQWIYPYYGASGIIDYVNEYIFDWEYLLISEDWANLVARKYPIAFLATGKFWINNHSHIVRWKQWVTDSNYLRYYFASIDISEFLTWSAQPKLSQGKLNQIQIPLPPLPRQHEIVAHLDTVFEKTRVLRFEYMTQIQDLEILKQSLLEEAFAGRLVQENEA